ncbi:DNA topoisomerase IB [Compostibacter hankyongensis]|uniref:DNA topoisomerase n=1 Tax=Compostibacter hankyongensis TaxID=1007089 RepID=A0ABP8FCR2_9BACT
METATAVPLLAKKKLRIALDQPEKGAAMAQLVYVSDDQAGITRERKQKGFAYFLAGKMIREKKTLERIRALRIPPAWERVWICRLPNGHLQATGVDKRGRKQYLYHCRWTALRGQTKFLHLHAFGEALPEIRRRVSRDLSQEGLGMPKVMALIVRIMEQTTIRIGSEFYEKLYGSFGISTLKNRHVKIKGSSIRFIFKGKKGVEHDIGLRSRKLARLIQRCKDIPGKDLLKYVDAEGVVHDVTSGDINAYIGEISGGEFTSKDFRTWAGSVECLRALAEGDDGNSSTQGQIKQQLVAALDQVAFHLGNTRSVCKKHYVHPAILEGYESGRLMRMLRSASRKKETRYPALNGYELLLMRLLKKKPE